MYCKGILLLSPTGTLDFVWQHTTLNTATIQLPDHCPHNYCFLWHAHTHRLVYLPHYDLGSQSTECVYVYVCVGRVGGEGGYLPCWTTTLSRVEQSTELCGDMRSTKKSGTSPPEAMATSFSSAHAHTRLSETTALSEHRLKLFIWIHGFLSASLSLPPVLRLVAFLDTLQSSNLLREECESITDVVLGYFTPPALLR